MITRIVDIRAGSWDRFINALVDATENGFDRGIAISPGLDQDKRPIVVMSIDDRHHALYPDDAERLAAAVEEIALDPSDKSDWDVASSFIVGLRAAAEKAESL